MAAQDRLYGWGVSLLTLYLDKGTAADSIGQSPMTDLTAAYQSCLLKIEDHDFEARATAETWDYPIPLSSAWEIEVGAVLDLSFYTLAELRLTHGRGPFWAVMQVANLTYYSQFYGRVLITQPTVSFSEEAAGQHGVLRGVGPLNPGPVKTGTSTTQSGGIPSSARTSGG